MATTYENRVPTWFWIVSGVALLWEAFGCFSYVSQVTMTPDQIAALSDAEQKVLAAMPGWLTAVFAIAVWSGLLAAILLLMRRSWAVPLFGISLIAILVQFGYFFAVVKAAELLGTSAYEVPAAVIVMGVLLLWFALMASRRGWLR